MVSAPRSRSLWSWIVTITLLFTMGCHWIYGSYELDPDVDRPGGLCRNGATRCNNENLLECSSDHSAWILDQTCASKEQCDSANGCLICPQADMRRCNGAMIEACNAQRTQWKEIEKCDSSDACSAIGCGVPCTPDEVDCAVDQGRDVVRVCGADNRWKVRATCPTRNVCENVATKVRQDPASWDGTCEGVCKPGDDACDGATLNFCSMDQVTLNKIHCDSEALCVLTLTEVKSKPELKASLESCNPGCGTPGAPRCRDNRFLERCSADRTTWEPVMECTGMEQCATDGLGGCTVCQPGEYQCNGAVLQRCGADNRWSEIDTCASPSLCSKQGQCKPPACKVPGEFSCGTATEPLMPGNRLWQCNLDRSDWVPGEFCETSALCSAADKTCKKRTCDPGRRCNPANRLLVEECNPELTSWNTVATCKPDEFCVPSDLNQPCHASCPGALMCNDRFLQTCSNEAGIKLKAECLSKELCECAITGTCAGGTDAAGCGIPVCGGAGGQNLRCTEGKSGRSLLQRCNSGRDGWTSVKDCESQALCSADSSSCLVCPTANLRECASDGLSTRVCSADRLSWKPESDCRAHGCYSGMYGPYCAPCDVGQLNCSGSKLQQCRQDEGGWEFKQDCEFGCIGSGNSVGCATCAKDELRCSSDNKQVLKCSADQKSLTVQQSCANGCINSGNADYCAECTAGATQCTSNKAGMQTCGADGRWGTLEPCANGCVDEGNTDYCSGCAAGEKRCSGNTLLTCNADRTMLVNPQACGTDGCVDSGIADYCAACQQNEKRCMGATEVRTCASDRMSLVMPESCTFGCRDSGTADFCLTCATGELRCNGSNLMVCKADQTGLISNMTCTNGCFEGGLADYCGECTPKATRCTTAGLQTCGDNGRWGAAGACANGCFSNSTQGAYCGDCVPGEDTQCATGGLQSCTTAGRWSTTTTSCTRGCIDNGDQDFCALCSPGDHSCSGNMLQSCSGGRYMPPGSLCDLGCMGSAPNARCAACTNGDQRCNSGGTAIELCMNGEWTSDMSCAKGCFEAEEEPFCGVCSMGDAECVTGGRRVCMNGQWGTPAACPNNGACLNKQCVACTPGDTQCSGMDSLQTCTSTGTWGAAAPCENDACLMDECVECMPNATQCASAGTQQVCNAQGSWGTATACTSGACLNNACTACNPGATMCANATQERVCTAQGTWGTASTCTGGACLGDACVECSPGSAQCTMGKKRRVCATDGTWGMESSCDIGCVDSGTMDYCAECAEGDSSCTDGMVKMCTAAQRWGPAEACPDDGGCDPAGEACAGP